jgi:hypothetical protein
MLKQIVHTYSYDGSDGQYNYPADWFPMNCSGYDTVSITINSDEGWDGHISFWGGAGIQPTGTALWSLVNASSNNNYDTINNVIGATPTGFHNNYTGPIAGLSTFGVYFANPADYVSAVGIIKIEVGFYSSAK